MANALERLRLNPKPDRFKGFDIEAAIQSYDDLKSSYKKFADMTPPAFPTTGVDYMKLK